MTIKDRIQRLESMVAPAVDPAAALADCDPLSVAMFVAEAHGKLGALADQNPPPNVRRILEYIGQNPEKYPCER